MAKQGEQEKEKTATERLLTVQVQYSPDAIETRFTNFIRFSHLAADVIMDVGVLDDQALIAELGKPSEALQVDAFISRRYGMSIRTLKQVRKNIDDILSKLAKSGVEGNKDE